MNRKEALSAIAQIDLSTLSDYTLEEIIKSYCINKTEDGCGTCPLLRVNQKSAELSYCRKIDT